MVGTMVWPLMPARWQCVAVGKGSSDVGGGWMLKAKGVLQQAYNFGVEIFLCWVVLSFRISSLDLRKGRRTMIVF